jgi:hypothetical protein
MAIVIQREPLLRAAPLRADLFTLCSAWPRTRGCLFVHPVRARVLPKGVALDLAIVLDGELVAIHLAIHFEGHFTVLVFAVLNFGLHVQNGHCDR